MATKRRRRLKNILWVSRRCLPGLDGADFVRELRKRATLFGLLSDRLVPRWARVAQAIGAYDVLLKPLRAAQVDNFLAAWNRTCQPANVLLVESSQKTLDVVARLLRQSSFKLNLDFSGTAREALKALVPEFYDIAFVNIALADGSGVETALRVIAGHRVPRSSRSGTTTGSRPPP
jgi:DNA-binding response OmpR family regulator